MNSINDVTGNALLDGLSQADFGLLRPHLSEVFLEQNVVLSESCADIDAVWFPTGAILSVIVLMNDGQGVGACTIGHESAYGLIQALGAAMATDRTIAQVPGTAMRMANTRLKAAASSSASLNNLIVRHIQADLIQTKQSVACNALHHVEARLCRWLLMSQDRTRIGPLPLTQEYLGFMLGVSRTTVTGAARALQSAGLISYVRGQINILDRSGLEDGACECYLAAKNKRAELFGLSKLEAEPMNNRA